MQKDNRDKQEAEDSRHEYIPGVQEKSTLGGAFNTGVTSDDPDEKDEIEKKGALANLKPKTSDDESRQNNSGQ
jgi:hypothetical protein